MGVAATVPPRGLGPQNPTKKLAQWIDLFGQPLSRKRVSEIFGSEPPSPLNLLPGISIRTCPLPGVQFRFWFRKLWSVIDDGKMVGSCYKDVMK